MDTDCDKGTQTNRGFWLDESSIQPHHRQHGYTTDSHIPDQMLKQVNLVGCVNVRRKDLIPDGRGGYFVHITKREIERNEPPSNWSPNVSNFRQPPPPLPSFQNNAYGGQHRQTYPKVPYVKRSRWGVPDNGNWPNPTFYNDII